MIYFTNRAKFAASRTPCKAYFQLQIALAFAVTLIPRCRIPKAAALGIKDCGQAAEHLSPAGVTLCYTVMLHGIT